MAVLFNTASNLYNLRVVHNKKKERERKKAGVIYEKMKNWLDCAT